MSKKRTILSVLRVFIYNKLVNFVPWKLRTFYGIEIGKGTRVSRFSNLDKNINPKGIHIGKYSTIAGSTLILAHDACRQMKGDVYIGDNCFVGTRTIILPNVRIGNECIIGAGSVVTKDIPDNCIAAGNPARIIKTGIHCAKYGRIVNS